MMFECERCGQCCRRVGRTILAGELALPDGSCRHLDKATNLCRIYAERPMICRVDDFYDAYLTTTLSREEFYRENKEICRRFQSEKI